MIPGVAGIKFHGASITGDGFIQPACILEDFAKIVMGIGIVGLDRQCLAATHFGVIQLPRFLLGDSQIIVCLGISGADLQRPAEAFGRLGKMPAFDQRCSQAGLRVESDLRNEKINYKIREHSLLKRPYLVVVGDKEKEAGLVAVRARGNQDLGQITPESLIERLLQETRSRG